MIPLLILVALGLLNIAQAMVATNPFVVGFGFWASGFCFGAAFCVLLFLYYLGKSRVRA